MKFPPQLWAGEIWPIFPGIIFIPSFPFPSYEFDVCMALFNYAEEKSGKYIFPRRAGSENLNFNSIWASKLFVKFVPKFIRFFALLGQTLNEWLNFPKFSLFCVASKSLLPLPTHSSSFLAGFKTKDKKLWLCMKQEGETLFWVLTQLLFFSPRQSTIDFFFLQSEASFLLPFSPV